MIFTGFPGSQSLHHAITGTLAEQIIALENSPPLTQIAQGFLHPVPGKSFTDQIYRRYHLIFTQFFRDLLHFLIGFRYWERKFPLLHICHYRCGMPVAFHAVGTYGSISIFA